MNVETILKESMALIGLPDDEETYKLWRTRLLHWCNEGLMDLGLTLRPWAREPMVIFGKGNLYTDGMSYQCVKVLAIEKGERHMDFYYGLSPQNLVIPGTEEGDMVDVVYRYMPRDLEEDWEEPELPEGCHRLLVLYIVAREKCQLDAGACTVGSYSLALYEKMKKNWIRNQPPPWENQFYNMY